MNERRSRRVFLRETGTLVLGFWAGGTLLQMTPAEARAQRLPLRVLGPAQVHTLEALAELLLPGSAAAGIAHFIDHQLAAPAEEQMLMIKYLGVEPPFQAFYTAGFAALDACAMKLHGRIFPDLEPEHRGDLAGRIAQANPEGWDGPPAPLFHFVLRSDALDVVYGTRQGVESLGLPYMAHIVPPSRWGEA
ncbi:MAG TPA: gluconate 2-dehydrogenase subunit 3 family protein [Xanthomonadales bacterium]|nr:gluconate 2-dehydrogenase subunit 3 family protein [Xanthomonadales bacterium]